MVATTNTAEEVVVDDSPQPPIPLRSEGLRSITRAPAHEATFCGIRGGHDYALLFPTPSP